MHIGIDCRAILDPERGELAGIAHYVHFLVKHLLLQDEENRYTLFFDSRTPKRIVAEALGSNHRARAVTLPEGRATRLLPYAWSHMAVPAAIAKADLDVFHAPTGSLPMGYKGKSVVTVHDLAIYLHPEWFPGGQLFSRRVVVPASLRRADRVIAVSHVTAADLQRLFAVPSSKISVIRHGVEFAAHRDRDGRDPALARFGLTRPYLLFLGTIEPRKNVEGLVHAFVSLAERFPKLVEDLDLAIAGAVGWKADAALAAIEAAGRKLGPRGPRIKLLGRIEPADKLPLMAHALAFVFPSLYEGFGLPVLEAMSLGVPVVASSAGAIPEVAGRGAALLVDPHRHEEIALAIKHLLEDPAKREALGRRGYERAQEFRWERAAGETIEVYEAAARDRAPE